MAKARKDIQKQSDQRRGVKNKAFTIPITTIDDIIRICDERGISHAAFLVELVEDYKKRGD